MRPLTPRLRRYPAPLGALLLALASLALPGHARADPSVIPSTAARGADTFIGHGTEADSNLSGEQRLRIRNDSANQPARPHRKTYLRFDLATGAVPASEAAEAALGLTWQSPQPGTFRVYGIRDGAHGDAEADWTLTGITWNNAPQNNTSNASAMESGADLLFTFTPTGLESSGAPLTLSSAQHAALLDFLRADTNGLVTFVVTQQNTTSSSLEFTSARHPTATPPTLTLTPAAPPPALPPNLQGLRPHPRLLWTVEGQAHTTTLAATNPLLAGLIGVVEAQAEAALTDPELMAHDPDSSWPRRRAMFRIFNLALTYRLTGDTRFALRARDEMIHVAGLPKWHDGQDHLHVAEICAFMGIGYDWLHDYLSPADRLTIRNGIVARGLNPAKTAYSHFWGDTATNWNQVCNAGFTIAALAVADEEPELASEVLALALDSIPYGMSLLHPDGASEEGPTYWAYGVTYQALMFGALQSALGHSHGLDQNPHFQAMGRGGAYHVHTISPTSRYFDYGDSKPVAFFSPVLFWLSGQFAQPVYAWFERQLIASDLPRMQSGGLMTEDSLDRFLALLVIWFSDAGQNVTYQDLPLDMQFRSPRSPVAAMRGSWTDPGPTYLGFKGGHSRAEHGHMDIGSFILESRGVRWAVDLGADSYEVPGCYSQATNFDKSGGRWRIYRNNNFSHNTLVIDGNLHNNTSSNPVVGIESFSTTTGQAYATLDMTTAYAGLATSVRRGFAMLERNRVLVEDLIAGTAPGKRIRWGMVTEADLEISGARATLSQGGKTLYADIVEPAGATFESVSTDPYATDPYGNSINPVAPNPCGQNTNDGTRMLAVHLTAGSDPIRLTILFTPADGAAEHLPPPDFRPLGIHHSALPLPNGWQHARIGSSNAAGSADFYLGHYQIRGAGTDIGGTADSLQLAWRNIEGDAEIVARVIGQQETHTGAKAGIMFRASSASGAPNVFLAVTPSQIALQHRLTSNGTTTTAASAPNRGPFPIWLKLRRESGSVRAFTSADGNSWAPLGSPIAINLPATAHLGLAACSRINNTLGRAHFDSVSASPHSALPEVNALAPSPNAAKLGPIPGALRVSRTGPVDQPLSINVTLGGTARPGVDYLLTPDISDTLLIPAAAAHTDLTITPLQPSDVTGPQTVTLTLGANATTYSIGASPSAAITVTDHPVNQWKIGAFASLPGGASHPLAADAADPNANSIPNLLEYAFNSDPLGDGGVTRMPSAGLFLDGAETYLTFAYRRRPDGITLPDGSYSAAGIRYSILFSETLQPPWQSAADLTTPIGVPIADDDGTEAVTLRLTHPLTHRPGFFLRLQVARE